MPPFTGDAHESARFHGVPQHLTVSDVFSGDFSLLQHFILLAGIGFATEKIKGRTHIQSFAIGGSDG
ncbi:hypothetical protein COLO4_02116 [Corchorus olitorius]|uniref:Uncharacterized protein n=1 Tax=Corchorus olitorius TaxID=93759 RepID=A0A1R3L1M2_9ROSI|nr:hypothetical protein COLO4_02116 [Corchorus olitorius]